MTKDEPQRASLKVFESQTPSRSATPTINTPSSGSPFPSQPPSRLASPFSRGVVAKSRRSPPPKSPLVSPKAENFGGDFKGDPDTDDEEDMVDSRPTLHRPTDGRSQTPLLKEERRRPSYDSPNGSSRTTFFTRSSTFRNRSPDLESSSVVKKKYTYAAFFLIMSLISFVVQTETAVYIQHELGWNNAYAML